MNRQYRRVLPLLTAAALAVTPMEALAENPQFAHDEATWERLKDNVMEYDELSLLVARKKRSGGTAHHVG